MFTTRVWHKTNKEYQCFVPPLLQEGILGSPESLELDVYSDMAKKFGDFSLADFSARYLAGDLCLREGRRVSRRRLALASSGIDKPDAEADALNRQINSYNQARRLLVESSNIDLEVICEVNRLVASGSKKPGIVRKSQNWVGGKCPHTAGFVTPPPDLLPELLQDWFAFVNDPNIDLIVRGIVGHAQLINIHPFSDGNGRASRILLDAFIQKALGEGIHPSLYRLGNNSGKYIDALQAFGVDSEVGIDHEYWPNAFSWGKDCHEKIFSELDKARSKLMSKIGMVYLSGEAKQLLNYLWKQPVVAFEGLNKQFGWSANISQQAIRELVELNILVVRKLRHPHNALVFDCPVIFDAWIEVDELLFDKLADKIEEAKKLVAKDQKKAP